MIMEQQQPHQHEKQQHQQRQRQQCKFSSSFGCGRTTRAAGADNIEPPSTAIDVMIDPLVRPPGVTSGMLPSSSPSKLLFLSLADLVTVAAYHETPEDRYREQIRHTLQGALVQSATVAATSMAAQQHNERQEERQHQQHQPAATTITNLRYISYDEESLREQLLQIDWMSICQYHNDDDQRHHHGVSPSNQKNQSNSVESTTRRPPMTQHLPRSMKHPSGAAVAAPTKEGPLVVLLSLLRNAPTWPVACVPITVQCLLEIAIMLRDSQQRHGRRQRWPVHRRPTTTSTTTTSPLPDPTISTTSYYSAHPTQSAAESIILQFLHDMMDRHPALRQELAPRFQQAVWYVCPIDPSFVTSNPAYAISMLQAAFRLLKDMVLPTMHSKQQSGITLVGHLWHRMTTYQSRIELLVSCLVPILSIMDRYRFDLQQQHRDQQQSHVPADGCGKTRFSLDTTSRQRRLPPTVSLARLHGEHDNNDDDHDMDNNKGWTYATSRNSNSLNMRGWTSKLGQTRALLLGHHEKQSDGSASLTEQHLRQHERLCMALHRTQIQCYQLFYQELLVGCHHNSGTLVSSSKQSNDFPRQSLSGVALSALCRILAQQHQPKLVGMHRIASPAVRALAYLAIGRPIQSCSCDNYQQSIACGTLSSNQPQPRSTTTETTPPRTTTKSNTVDHHSAGLCQLNMAVHYAWSLWDLVNQSLVQPISMTLPSETSSLLVMALQTYSEWIVECRIWEEEEEQQQQQPYLESLWMALSPLFEQIERFVMLMQFAGQQPNDGDDDNNTILCDLQENASAGGAVADGLDEISDTKQDQDPLTELKPVPCTSALGGGGCDHLPSSLSDEVHPAPPNLVLLQAYVSQVTPLLQCLAFILSRRGTMLMAAPSCNDNWVEGSDNRVDIDSATRDPNHARQFRKLLSLLSVALDHLVDSAVVMHRIDLWLHPATPLDEQRLIVTALQAAGILGLCEGRYMKSMYYDDDDGSGNNCDIEGKNVLLLPFPVGSNSVRQLVPRLAFDFPDLKDCLSECSPHNAVPLSWRQGNTSGESSSSKKGVTEPATLPVPILDYLSGDLISHIFTFLGYKRLVRMRAVCRDFQILADQSRLWRVLYQSRFGLLDDDPLLAVQQEQEQQASCCSRHEHTAFQHSVRTSSSLLCCPCPRDMSLNFHWKIYFQQQWEAERTVRFHRNTKTGFATRICGYVGCYAVLKTPRRVEQHVQRHQEAIRKQMMLKQQQQEKLQQRQLRGITINKKKRQ